MQFSQILAFATFTAMAYAAALPAPEAAPVAAPNADAEADPGLCESIKQLKRVGSEYKLIYNPFKQSPPFSGRARTAPRATGPATTRCENIRLGNRFSTSIDSVWVRVEL